MFHGRAIRPRPGELEEFAGVLTERLRLGQSQAASFQLEWGTGGNAAPRVVPMDAASETWWREVALSGFPSMTWRRDRSPPSATDEFWSGTPLADAATPFRCGGTPPWSDGLVPALRSAPPGWSIRWTIEGGGRPESAPILRPGERLKIVPPNLRSPTPVPGAVREVDDLRESRRLQPKWAVAVGVRGPPEGAPGPGAAILRALTGASRLEGGNGLRFVEVRRSWPWQNRRFLLSTTELLGLLPTPWSPWSASGEGYAPGTRFWRIGADELGREVHVPVEPGNGRHLLLVGETGMGKSTLLVRMATSATRLGTVVLLDPIGDTGRDFLASLPADRTPPPTWIAPNDSPIPLNALDSAHGSTASSERAISDLVGALRRVRSARFESGPFWGPRLEEATHWALTAAAGLPSGTLVDAERMLADPHAQAGPLTGGPAETALRALRTRARDRPEDLEGAHRMLSEATRSSMLRELLSEPHARWSVRKALAPRSATVVTGDVGAVGAPSARTLLALYLALLGSAVVDRDPSTPLFLFLDEASVYAHESLAELLRVGRRWGVHVVIATQSLEAFPPDLREALWTNSSDQVRFRGSPTEARELERWGAGLTTERLVALPRGVAAALLGKGREVRWIVTAPLERRRDAEASCRRAVLASRAHWMPDPLPIEAEEPPVHAPARPGPTIGVAAEVEAVFESISLHCTASTEDEVALNLGEWRAADRLTMEAIREAGRRLASLGLVRSEHGTDGTTWKIPRVRFLQWRRGHPSAMFGSGVPPERDRDPRGGAGIHPGSGS
ncbi:MAG: hypothetical protein L3K08_05285 [Thermoplasmata archaeon]|nr:hypothetical protein [Thermoplasmata archaeon]